jgi:glycosyltransferase involved in cell wall biosynthesis
VKLLLSIHHRLDPNAGAPGATLALGDQLARMGHSVSYLSHDDLPDRLPGLAKELLFPEFAAIALRRRAASVDVVDASTGDAWLWARLRRRGGRASTALVTRAHGLEHRFWDEELAEARAEGRALPLRTRLYHGGLRLREVAASLRASDACVFLNRADRDYAVERLAVTADRAHVVPNGIPSSFLGPVPDAQLHGAEIGIAHIGSWAERKGSRYLAEAIGSVLERHPGAHLSLLGTRAPAELVRSAFPEAVRSRVAVVPEFEHEQLPDLLEGHRIAVSAALAEGFSLALPEAMARALAPVATAVGAAPELIRDGENGLLVPPRDARELESAVAGLVESPARLGALRRAARETAERYSWEAVARENVAVYEAARAYTAGRSASAIT